MYNLAKRQAEVELLPLAETENLAVVSYSPRGGGLLTGKYGIDKKPSSGRLLEIDKYAKRYNLDQYYETAERFTSHAKEHTIEPATLGVAWVLSHPSVTAPIIGARNLEQLQASLNAIDVEMTPEWRQEISALSPEPTPATDRLEETM